MSSNPAINIGISATNTAKAVLDDVDKSIRNTTNIVETEGNKTISKSRQIADAFKANFMSIGMAATGLAAGIVGFATSFSTLEKAKVSAERATLLYNKSLERLKEMQDKGTYSAAELANQQEQVRLNSEKARLAQDDLNDTYANFLANIPSQLMSFGVSANAIFTMLKGQHVSTAATAASSSVVYSGALTAMNASTSAASKFLQLFRVASISAFITNPAGIAIIGITTLIAALVLNVGGLRDMFVNLGGTIMSFLDQHFRPLADGIRWFLGLFGGLTDAVGKDMPASVAHSNEALGSLGMATGAAQNDVIRFDNELHNMQVELGTNTPVAATAASVALASAGDQIGVKLPENIGKANESMGFFQQTVEVNGEKIKQTFIGIRDKVKETLDDIDNRMRETIKISDELVASVSRAPTPWGDTLGVSDTISAVATRGAPSVSRAAPITSREGVTNYLNSITAGVPVKKGASGFDLITTGPMLALVGEAGVPERLTATPLGSGGGSGATHIHIHVGSQEIAEAIVGDITRIQNRNTRVRARTIRQRLV